MRWNKRKYCCWFIA